MRTIDYALGKIPLNGVGTPCGDDGFIHQWNGDLFIALVDGLGHGESAHEAAEIAKERFAESCHEPLNEILSSLHDRLRNTVGAVAGIARLNIETGDLSYCGVGNITARIYGSSPQKLLSREGVIGYSMPSPRTTRIQIQEGDILVLTSDGIIEHFEPADFPNLLNGNAALIAERFLAYLRREDDSSCLVVRYT